ncbi:MAG: hypothetical protein HXS44_10650 [Theionarchaea archaeon]|nr:hypothetical protein [Theionarchaea archaeon]
MRSGSCVKRVRSPHNLQEVANHERRGNVASRMRLWPLRGRVEPQEGE